MPDESIAPLSKGQAKLIAAIETEANAIQQRLSAVVATVLAGLDVEGGVQVVSMDLIGDSPSIVFRSTPTPKEI